MKNLLLIKVYFIYSYVIEVIFLGGSFMLILQKAALVVTGTLMLFDTQVYATCARCTKIEAERAQEEREHPHHWGYYDDQGTSDHSPIPSTPTKNAEKLSQDPLKAQDKMNSQNYLMQSNLPGLKEIAQLSKDDLSMTSNHVRYVGQEQDYSVIFTILDAKNFLNVLSGPFTIFIPTDEALRGLPPRTLEALLKPENREKLSAIVSNHVVDKQILKEDIKNNQGKEIKTIGGHNLILEDKEGIVTVDGVRVLRIEAAGNNGVIYIIDQLLEKNP